MKKYGKYEKRPEGVPAKQPKVKSALLQTYLTSLLCMVLCVTMFFGTSYAWFTSEVNNTANEIYIGTLDVELEKQVGGAWKSLSELTDGANTTKLFDNNIRWEPGYTALETIKVVNEGDLAFKYVLSFTDGSLAEESKLSIENVAKYFDVWVYDHRDNENVVPAPASYANITAKNSGWENTGSLEELLAGKTVLDGNMVTVRKEGQEATDINKGTTDGVATEDTYTIALHMKEEATADVMGQRITLNVKLVAYQMSSTQETDGLGGNYDDFTAVMNAEDLSNALGAGKNVLMLSNIAIERADDRLNMAGGVLDGNKETITYAGEQINESSMGVLTTTGGIVRNLTIAGGENGRALYVTKLTSDLFVSDCTLSGAYAFNVNSAEVTGKTMTFVDTTFKSWTSYANVMEHAYFTNCTFENVLRPYGDTTLTNCTFTTAGLDVSALENDETITLINCTYNGVLVEKAVLTANSGEITITENDLIVVDANKQVVLKNNG